ncbi:hypothetical protein C7B69_09055 [filamentous cyanobacterium Phorm 46]|nr:hypothetical protein C7B69_09055 [filamentous cyanobacterium Phorm 46]
MCSEASIPLLNSLSNAVQDISLSAAGDRTNILLCRMRYARRLGIGNWELGIGNWELVIGNW